MASPLYVPSVRYKETPDSKTHLYLYKVVRIGPPHSPKATTVSFDWKRYNKLLAKHGITGREFGKLVRAAYAELAAEGFANTHSKSHQLWWRVVRKLEAGEFQR